MCCKKESFNVSLVFNLWKKNRSLVNANRIRFNHTEIVGAATLKSVTRCIYIYIEVSYYRLRWRFALASLELKYYKTMQRLWNIYRDISVKMRFRVARLIAMKFTSIKSLTRITVKIYCRAKRRVSSHLVAHMILLIIITISVLLIAIIDCIMLDVPPMTRRLTLLEAWPVCEAKLIVIVIIPY